MNCPLRHRTPAQPDDGYTLCRGHISNLSDRLYAIGLICGDLDDLLVTPPPQDGNDRRIIRTEAPAPCRLDVVDLRDPRSDTPAIHLIGEWTRLVVAERRLAATPTLPTSQVQLLLTNLDWLARHEVAADFASEIADVHYWLRQAAGLTPPPPLFTCPVPDEQTGQPCGGGVRTQPYTFGVRCTKCGETWDGTLELRRLGLVREDTP